jgi:hypothetical protein
MYDTTLLNIRASVTGARLGLFVFAIPVATMPASSSGPQQNLPKTAQTDNIVCINYQFDSLSAQEEYDPILGNTDFRVAVHSTDPLPPL